MVVGGRRRENVCRKTAAERGGLGVCLDSGHCGRGSVVRGLVLAVVARNRNGGHFVHGVGAGGGYGRSFRARHIFPRAEERRIGSFLYYI